MTISQLQAQITLIQSQIAAAQAQLLVQQNLNSIQVANLNAK